MSQMKIATRAVRSFATMKAAGGQYLLPEHGRFGQVVRPARLEEFELHPHQDPSRDRDWSAEIRGFYRDLLKSIPTMKQRFRLVIPNEQVKKNIRKRFEQGPKLTDPAALRHRALMVSADLEDYFRESFMDSHVQGKYNDMDSKEMLKQELEAAASETQAAHRFFNEGTNVLLETAIGVEDVTENRVYMTREQAYRKGLASLRGDAAIQHMLPALDKANQATLEAIAAENDVQALVDLLATIPKSHNAEQFVGRCEAFHKAAGLPYNKASGGAVQKAWERYKDEEVNTVVLMHSAYKALLHDPKRNLLLRGAADWVQLAEAGDPSATVANSTADRLMKVAQHLYYSDQLPEGFAQDLGVSYLADLKGVDRRMDLILDEEIAYRQELLLKIQAHTAECMKRTASATDVATIKKHLDTYDWSTFVVTVDGAPSSCEELAL